jgi:hypothetical protein
MVAAANVVGTCPWPTPRPRFIGLDSAADDRRKHGQNSWDHPGRVVLHEGGRPGLTDDGWYAGFFKLCFN